MWLCQSRPFVCGSPPGRYSQISIYFWFYLFGVTANGSKWLSGTISWSLPYAKARLPTGVAKWNRCGRCSNVHTHKARQAPPGASRYRIQLLSRCVRPISFSHITYGTCSPEAIYVHISLFISGKTYTFYKVYPHCTVHTFSNCVHDTLHCIMHA